MKKRIEKVICYLLITISCLFLICCGKTNNEIYNTSYDVDITIDDLSEMLIPATKKASEAVIGVSTYVRNSLLASWKLKSTGSGVVYKAIAYMNNGSVINDPVSTINSSDVDYYEYYAITNDHVVASGNLQSQVKVFLGEINLLVNADVLGYNINEDLAVIKFTSTIYITPIEFGNSDDLEQGEFVLAIGNAEGYDYYLSTTFGIVSHPKRYMEVERDFNHDGTDESEVVCELIQHDAAINAGNSGGALVNIEGKLIGINTLKLIDKEQPIEGMGFAIPINIVKKYLSDLEKGVNTNSITFNSEIYSINEIKNQDVYNIPKITISNIDSLDYGIFIYRLTGLNTMGLKNNDILLELNGEILTNNEIFLAKLRYLTVSSNNEIRLIRDKKIIILHFIKI